jgi:signal transduction histidine kinase
MMRSESLGKRIVKAYLLFAVAFSLFFAMVAAVVVEGIEVRLVDDRLEGVAAWAMPRHAAGLAVEMPAGLSFHHGDEIPLSMRGLAPGIHDIDVDGIGLQVFAGQDSNGPFVAVDHESDYEKVELAVYSMLLLSLLGFMAMSVMLGRYMARRFVTPIVDLSTAVEERRPDLPLLANNDELGILARAFAGHTAELKQFLERERAFTGDVSHELRTPLTIISGAAELLMLEHKEKPASYAASERIYRAAREAAQSVDVLLLLARSPELIESEQFALAPLLRDEVARYQVLVANKPVALEFDGGADFTICAPRRLVAAAVGNLIRNACTYTDHGVVSVSLEGRCIAVRDSGRGLPAEVFQMLASDATGQRLRGSDGTGLGLALVKRICLQLQARLDVTPHEGGGTVFKLFFPVI